MLDYTRAIFDKTRKELNTALALFQFGTQAIYIAYLFYLVIAKNTIWYLHLALLLISIAFLVFDIVTTKNIRSIKNEKFSIFGKRKHNKKLALAKQKRKNVVRIKFYVSHVIKIFVLASAFYPIVVAPESVHPLSIMCTTAMVLLWIIQIVFEVLKLILEGRGELFMEALHADMEFVTKPVSNVKNAFNKIMGREVAEEEAPTKERVYLDELVQAAKDKKSELKEAVKAQRKEKRDAWIGNHFPKKKRVNETVTETDESLAVVSVSTDSEEN